jgi:hypothetical protein
MFFSKMYLFIYLFIIEQIYTLNSMFNNKTTTLKIKHDDKVNLF